MHTHLQTLAEFVAEHGFPAMVAGGVVVWYVPTGSTGYERCEARTWGVVRVLLGY